MASLDARNTAIDRFSCILTGTRKHLFTKRVYSFTSFGQPVVKSAFCARIRTIPCLLHLLFTPCFPIASSVFTGPGGGGGAKNKTIMFLRLNEEICRVKHSRSGLCTQPLSFKSSSRNWLSSAIRNVRLNQPKQCAFVEDLSL